MKRLPLIKHLVLGLAMLIAVVFSHTAVTAATVTYSTTCSFNGGAFSSPNAIVFGSAGNQLSITFTGVTNSTVNSNLSTFASLGQFQTATTGTGATITAGTTVALRITQTAPSGGTGTFSSTVFGVIRPNATTGQISFSVTSLTIGAITYTLVSPVVQFVPPANNNGVTTVQGQITSSSLAEAAGIQTMSWPDDYLAGSALPQPANQQLAPESPLATAVTYSTTCSFNGGAFSSPNAIVFGSMGNQLSLTCTGVTNSALSADPTTFASLGQIQTATTGTGATITPGTTFAIRITQTSPSSGNNIYSATLTGVVGPNSSTALISFTNTTTLIGGIPYIMSSGTAPLVPPSSGNGLISLQAQINLNHRRFDYDGDGRSDVSIFRPSTGVWHLNRSTAGITGFTWGIGTDKIVPADYDADGKTDVAVFRPSEGRWYIFNSATSTVSQPFWGISTDIPAPGDFDADGRADVAIFRPSDGNWWLNRTTLGSTTVPFGQNGDVPVVGDYDADGRSDIGVFRPSGGLWFIRRSTAGDIGYVWGFGTDKVVHADYDGDGKTDIAVYRPSEGRWYIANSGSATFPTHIFGAATDIPTPGDYDGDGRADVAIFRPSNGQWWLDRSGVGLITITFGQNGDKPTPNAFGN